MLYVFTMFPCVSDVTSLLMPPQWYSSLRSPHHPPHFIIIHDPKYGNRFALGLEISLGDRLLKIFGIKNKKNNVLKNSCVFVYLSTSLLQSFMAKFAKVKKLWHFPLPPPQSSGMSHCIGIHSHTGFFWCVYVCVKKIPKIFPHIVFTGI